MIRVYLNQKKQRRPSLFLFLTPMSLCPSSWKCLLSQVGVALSTLSISIVRFPLNLETVIGSLLLIFTSIIPSAGKRPTTYGQMKKVGNSTLKFSGLDFWAIMSFRLFLIAMSNTFQPAFLRGKRICILWTAGLLMAIQLNCF